MKTNWIKRVLIVGIPEAVWPCPIAANCQVNTATLQA